MTPATEPVAADTTSHPATPHSDTPGPAALGPATPGPAAPGPATLGPDPFEEIGRAFKAAMAAVRRLRGRETQRPGELSHAQYSLLFGLGDGARRSATELAQLADLAPATVTQMLDHLAAHALVVRTRSKVDKRVVFTSLTERGRTVIEEHRARIEPRWRAALSEFSDGELMTAAAVLDRVRTLFEEFEERSPGI